MLIEIVNWGKYNPRKDYKSMPWFKLESGFYRSKKLFGLPLVTKWVCLSLFCIAAEENKGGVIEAELDWLAEQMRLPADDLATSVEALASKGLIKVTYVTRTADERETNAPRSLQRKQRKQREQKNVDPVDLELAEAWEAHAKSLSPSLKPNRAKNVSAVAKLRAEGVDVRSLLDWIKASDFWRDKALSPVGLLKARPDGTRKLDTIRAQMQRPTTSAVPKTRGSQGYTVLTSIEELKS